MHTAYSKRQLCIYALGAFRIELDGHTVRLPTRKTEALLAYLVLHPQYHSRENLATLFWGDSSDTAARGSLRKALNFLRGELGSEIILANRETIQLDTAHISFCDAIEFESQASQFLSVQNPDLNLMDVNLYRDELLSGFYDDWILDEREHYHQLYIKVLLRAVESLRARSDYETAMQYARRILERDSTNEQAYQHLMFCHVALGDRTGAIQQYEACQQTLNKELDVKPARETRALYDWIVQSSSDSSSLSARITNLPIPISSFIGRSNELTEIKQILSNSRLLTLTGVGGSGKTRLAIRVGTDLINSYRHGVWWVDFSSLSNALLVPQSIAKALGVGESHQQTLTESIIRFLRNKEVLLILDNCEHLVEACAQLSNEILTQCPHLKIIATSREALRVNGEISYNVPTLQIPSSDKLSFAGLLLEYESVKLFVARARAVQNSFVWNDHTALFVVQICTRLDGIPLAIELAAARIKTMSVEQIAANLDDAFRLLTVGSRGALPRQQTLRAMIDWSYDLLSEEEKILFQRLAVFAGGWSLKAAEEVCADDRLISQKVADLLTNLVDKSLVIADSFDGQIRYYWLGTVRQYSQEKLINSRDLKFVRDQHCTWVLSWAEDLGPRLSGRDQPAWFRQIKAELGNIRAAVEWGLTTEQADLSMRIVHALSVYWQNNHPYEESRRWLEQGISHQNYLSKTTYAKMLLDMAWVAYRQNELEMALSCSDDALHMARELNDKSLLSKVLTILVLLTTASEQPIKNKQYSEEARLVYQELGDRNGLIILVGEQATALTYSGDVSRAVELLETNLHLLEGLDDISLVAWYQFLLGGLKVLVGELDQAEFFLKSSLVAFQQIANDYFIGLIIIGFASIANGRGDPKRAARLFGTADTILDDIGAVPEEGFQRIYSSAVAQTKSMLDEAGFWTAWVEGKGMTVDQAIRDALQIE